MDNINMTRRCLHLAVIGGALVALSSCAVLQTKSTRARFDGNYYPAKVERDESDRRLFLVTVGDATQGIEGAREAARYEATRYCIAQYGNSRVQWVVGPDAPASDMRVTDDGLRFQGACEGW